MAVERVNGYRTSDGRLFDQHQHAEAVKYEADWQFKQWCEANICRGGEWSASMVANAILEHWEVVPKSNTL